MMVASIFFEGITQKDVLVSVLFCLFWAFALNENQLKKWSTYAVLLYIALMVTFILIDGDGALFMIVKWSGLILWNAFPSIVENWRKSKSDGLSTLVYIGGLGLITGALLALSQKLGEWNIGYDIL